MTTTTTNPTERIYREGWAANDIAKVRPGYLLLEPIRPDPSKETQGGIILAPRVVDSIPGVSAIYYRVVAVADDVVQWQAGDFVVVRNGMLEPIHPSQRLLLCDAQHVLAQVLPEAT